MPSRWGVAPKTSLWVTIAVAIAAVATWRVTGGDYYTKFEVVETVERPVDPADPLAGTGFYEGDKMTETVRRKQFRLGLLPTPSRLVDKHMLSVVTLTTPFVILTLLRAWRARRRSSTGGGGRRTG